MAPHRSGTVIRRLKVVKPFLDFNDGLDCGRGGPAEGRSDGEEQGQSKPGSQEDGDMWLLHDGGPLRSVHRTGAA